jgi:hypothetical protein
VIVESCDEAIGKENDHLKKEVKRLEFKVNKLRSKPRCNLLKITIAI